MYVTCPACEEQIMAIIGGNIVKDKSGWRVACPFCGFGEEKIPATRASEGGL